MRFSCFINIIRNHEKDGVVSVIIAVLISFLCYFLNNFPYPYWDSLNKYSWLEYFLTNTVPEKNDRSDVFFINVSYDRQVVDYTYSNGNLQGTIDITNRETLLRFLKIAERTNSYKFIFLDIRFEKGIETVTDSALFAQIGKMRDVLYSSHSDLQNDHDTLMELSELLTDTTWGCRNHTMSGQG